jgi:hypothetical protein
MSNAKGDLQLIGTRGESSGLFRLSYGTEPNDPMPFILTLSPQYVACAIGNGRDKLKRWPCATG